MPNSQAEPLISRTKEVPDIIITKGKTPPFPTYHNKASWVNSIQILNHQLIDCTIESMTQNPQKKSQFYAGCLSCHNPQKREK